ncbi:MAG: sensor histidine kinase, partial [Isosphaeraceae bacterium]
IPCILVYFVLRKKDMPFRAIFWLFGAFILACGTTHLMEAIIFWWPAYRLAGLIKLFTAIVSWTTVIALVPLVPRALAMRSPEELEQEIAERMRAEEALRQYTERLQVLSRRVVEVQEEERRHLARELHDEIGQALTAIGINLEVIGRPCSPEDRPRIEDCLGIVHQATDQVHCLALDLRPSILDDLGLAAALRWLVDRQAQRAGFVGHFIDQLPGNAMHPDLATACFRVVQEALTNVVRHARARQVWVELQQGDAEVRLIIRDDGVGFDPGIARQRSARGASLGLLGIQERVELLGGQLAIESEPGHGTTVRVWLPATYTPPSGDPGEGGGG